MYIMPSNKQPLISIIVPVYNGEKYLPFLFKSLDSLLFKQYEIAFVDDGSKDNSLKMLQKYCRTNKKARVYHTSNHGAPFARNYGVSKTDGKYVYFLDADDSFHPSILTTLLRGLQSTNSDVSICSWHFFRSLPLRLKNKKNTYCKFRVVNGKQKVMQNFLGHLDKWIVPWNKIYKRSILKLDKNYPNIFPNNMSTSEDTIFNCKYFSRCNRIAITHKKLYWYRFLGSGTNSTIVNRKKFDDMKTGIEFIYKMKWINKQDIKQKEIMKRSAEAGCAFLAYDYLHKAGKTEIMLPKNDLSFVYKVYKKALKALFVAPKVAIHMKFTPPGWLWIAPRTKRKIKNR